MQQQCSSSTQRPAPARRERPSERERPPNFLNGQTLIELPFTFHRQSATGLKRKGSSKSRPMTLIEWIQGVSVPGAFKLDHLQPIEPILLPE